MGAIAKRASGSHVEEVDSCPKCRAKLQILRDLSEATNTLVYTIQCPRFPLECDWQPPVESLNREGRSYRENLTQRIMYLEDVIRMLARELEEVNGGDVSLIQGALGNLRNPNQVKDAASLRRFLLRLVVEWHPDKNPNGLDPNKVLTELNRAMNELEGKTA